MAMDSTQQSKSLYLWSWHPTEHLHRGELHPSLNLAWDHVQDETDNQPEWADYTVHGKIGQIYHLWNNREWKHCIKVNIGKRFDCQYQLLKYLFSNSQTASVLCFTVSTSSSLRSSVWAVGSGQTFSNPLFFKEITMLSVCWICVKQILRILLNFLCQLTCSILIRCGCGNRELWQRYICLMNKSIDQNIRGTDLNTSNRGDGLQSTKTRPQFNLYSRTHTEQKKKVTRCHSCGETGHWTLG